MVNSFQLDLELKISNEFLNNGYVIKKINQIKSFNWVQDKILKISKKVLKNKKLPDDFFNQTHKFVNLKDLNNFRVNVLNELNNSKEFKLHYYNIAREFLDLIVGNELAMQKRINLSVQLPNDSSYRFASVNG